MALSPSSRSNLRRVFCLAWVKDSNDIRHLSLRLTVYRSYERFRTFDRCSAPIRPIGDKPRACCGRSEYYHPSKFQVSTTYGLVCTISFTWKSLIRYQSNNYNRVSALRSWTPNKLPDSILEWFMKDHVTLNTRVMMLQIQLCINVLLKYI